MKALWAKKYAKMKKNQPESADLVGRVNEKMSGGLEIAARRSDVDKNYKVNSSSSSFSTHISIYLVQSKPHIHEKY